MLALGIIALCIVGVVLAVRSCPLARAVGRQVRQFAAASRPY